MAGTEELYLGRRMDARILPPTTVGELLGDSLGRAASRRRARGRSSTSPGVLTDRFAERLGPVVEELYPWTVDGPEHPRRFRERLTWLLLRRGRLDRGDPGTPSTPSTPDGAADPS